MSAHHAIKWSFLSETASKAIQPLVFVILARLLTPEDYGVVASATMVISFSQVFWEAGMSKSIIQYQGDRQAAANVAFWVNNALGFVVAVILVATSGLFAEKIFHDVRVALVLQVMSLQVFLSAASSIHTALLQKDMNFKSLFWVRITTVAIPGLFSIPLAFHGMGYWALVAGTLAGQAVQLVMLWQISLWKPELRFDFLIAKRLISFGGWVAISGLLCWFYIWADSLIVVIYLGSRDLGLYRVGNAFVTMIFGFVFGPLLPVLYSHFSNIQDNQELMKNTLVKVIKIITFLSIPMAFFIAVNSSFIANVVFGGKWQGVELVIAVLALMDGYSYIAGANGEAYRAIGQPYYETKIMALSLGFYLVGYWLSIQHGLEVFLWTRLSLSLAAMSVHLWVAKKIFNLSIKSILIYALKISLVCLPTVFIGGIIHFDSSLVSQTAILLTSTFLLTVSLFLVEKNGLIPNLLILVTRMKNNAKVV
jgi:O-antigen/teichoic acid export membrane protein